MIKKIYHKIIPEDKRKRFYLWRKHIKSKLSAQNLEKLAILYQTDKLSDHNYIQHYDQFFRNFRNNKLNILEIGVGGYDDPNLGGNSLRMWKYYFPKSMIYSIDIYDKSKLQEDRIKIFRGSQTDEKFLHRIYDKIGSLDIIIDDGSHENNDVIKTFKILFPLLNQNGIYVIEDTQTSYWPKFGGDSDNLSNPKTAMNFFKALADSLNYSEFIKPDYKANYYDKNITAVHFYHNLIFIFKGKNNEGSNTIVKNLETEKYKAMSN
jgi:hypothetical protein